MSDLRQSKQNNEAELQDEFSLEAILAEFGSKSSDLTQEPMVQEPKTPVEVPETDTSAEMAEPVNENPPAAKPAAPLCDTNDLKRTVANVMMQIGEVDRTEDEEDTKSFEPGAKRAKRAKPEVLPEEEATEQLPEEETVEQLPEEETAEQLPEEEATEQLPEEETAEQLPEEEAIEQLPEEEATEQLPEEETTEPQSAERPDFVPEEPEGAAELTSLEQVLSQTVESILEEDDAILKTRVPLSTRLRRFAQKLQNVKVRRKKENLWDEPEREEDAAEPEMDLDDAAHEAKRLCKKIYRQLTLSCVPMALLVACAILHELRWMPQVWWDIARLRYGICGGLLALELILIKEVWVDAMAQFKRRRMTCSGAAVLAALVTVGTCVCYAVSGEGELPLCAPVGVMIWLCLYGRLLAEDARAKAFRLADIGGEPPYAVEVTRAGACKQCGRLDGFYTTAMKPDPAQKWQIILVPLLVTIATVLSLVVSIGNKDIRHFLWIWSAMLCGSLPLALPLTGTLPLAYLNRRLNKGGSAVAGYQGARAVSASKRMIVTDNDLFPPGTVGINGLKVYGEEISKVVSYAATVTQAARSQLNPLFEQLLTAEGGCHLPIDDLHYYEEGGIGGTIRGETVTMGSAYFMRKNRVALPHDLKLKTGAFLAVDGTLVAVFAIKYQPSRNVEWALRALRRSHITPVLAVRSSNITPPLLRRKFNLDCKPVYPDVSTRLALSELSDEVAERPNAVIYREGLMPFAETVIGSRRMTSAVKLSTCIAYFGALCGLLLTYYLTNIGDFGALTPIRVLIFGLLWTVPTLLLGGSIKHY